MSDNTNNTSDTGTDAVVKKTKDDDELVAEGSAVAGGVPSATNTNTTNDIIDTLQNISINGGDTSVTTPITTKTEETSLTNEQKQLLEAIDPRYNRRFLSSTPTTSTLGGTSISSSEESTKKHAFWDTQPMPRNEIRNTNNKIQGSDETIVGDDDNSIIKDGPIVPNKIQEEIRQEPYTMPNGFVWSNVNVQDPIQLNELYNLLTNNYVEDDDALFRFDYSIEFLLWALDPPLVNKDFIFGVRSQSTNKLMAFISGIPACIDIHLQKNIPVVEVNFLCVHKKLRAKRLAPVLIKEITRRVNLSGVFQAVYTAGQLLPTPVGSARYYHRSLNPKKLVSIGFSRLPSNSHRMTLARLIKLAKLPITPITPGLRPMTIDDVPGVHTLLNNYLQQFSIKVNFTIDDIAHWLLPRPNVINSYVIEQVQQPTSSTTSTSTTATTSGEHKIITDFISFYHLHSSVLSNNNNTTTTTSKNNTNNDPDTNNTKLYAAYSYYNVATTVSLQQLMKDALIIAKNYCHCDVFNALDLMENNLFLNELKFGIGDGILQYYIYNWTCPTIQPTNVGIVLL